MDVIYSALFEGDTTRQLPKITSFLVWIFGYGEKFLWLGVPQQTSLTLEMNLSQYAIEIKCLTLKDQTSYLIPDG